MTPHALALSVASIIWIASSQVQAASAKSQEFIRKAAVGGIFEIRSSSLAIERTNNADISRFAQRMHSEHRDANQALKMTTRAAAPDVELPATLDPAHRAIIDDLKSKTGEDFDAAYVHAQSNAHFEAVALFTDYANNGDDPKLRAFAADTLPKLQAHQDALVISARADD
jgi:putative membrane protein